MPNRFAVLTLSLFLAGSGAGAQTAVPGGAADTSAMPHMHHPSGAGPAQPASPIRAPVEAGQAAFATIQEIVGILQSDPATDWSRVDIDALRRHLIDMDEVTLRAETRKTQVENGLRIAVTGTGRTREAIQRMVPAHSKEIAGMHGWTVTAKTIAEGVELTVTAATIAEVRKLRALGFMGIMAQGGHHQAHHLAMARGVGPHAH